MESIVSDINEKAVGSTWLNILIRVTGLPLQAAIHVHDAIHAKNFVRRGGIELLSILWS